MRRSGCTLVVAVAACFSEGSSGSDTGVTDTDSTTALTITDATSGTADGSTTMTADSSAGPTTASSDPTTGDSVTTGPDELCNWDLEWPNTQVKDILVVVHDQPPNLGNLVMTAEDQASAAGHHIAIASTCPNDCGTNTDGYEHHALTPGNDPLVDATQLMPSEGFFREHAPRHVVIVTDVDTTWSMDMIGGEPRFAAAQIHVRTAHATACGDTPLLDALATATQGTSSCGDSLGMDILDGPVIGPQPGCELFGTPADGPGADPFDSTMTLEGMTPRGGAMLEPPGPGVCANAPDGWSFIDAVEGHLELCPVACRDVGRWAPKGRTASIDFPC